jgi:TRAP-type C4-dicarboxylate transport system permease small subunit
MVKNIFSYLDRFIEIIVFLIFVVIGMVGGLQVFNRFVLNRSISWSEEMQIYGHIWLIFMTIPVAYRRGSHIGMNILVRKFSQKTQAVLVLVADFMWLGLAGAIVNYATVIMKVAKNQISPGLGLRMDLMYLSLVLSGSYLALVALRKIVESFPRLKSGEWVGGSGC